MTKKAVGKKVVSLLAILIVLSGILYWGVTSNAFLVHVALPWISKTTHLDLAAERVDLSLWNGSLAVKNLTIDRDGNRFFEAGEGAVTLSLYQLLFARNFDVDSLYLKDSSLLLKRNLEGDWNFKRPNKKQGQSDRKVQRKRFQWNFGAVEIVNSKFDLQFERADRLDYYSFEQLNATANQWRPGGTSRVSWSCGPWKIGLRDGATIQGEHSEITTEVLVDEKLRPGSFGASNAEFSRLSGSDHWQFLQDQNLTVCIDGHASIKNGNVEQFLLEFLNGEGEKSTLSLRGSWDRVAGVCNLNINVSALPEGLPGAVLKFSGKEFHPGLMTGDGSVLLQRQDREVTWESKLKLQRRGSLAIGESILDFPDWVINFQSAGKYNQNNGQLDLRQLAVQVTEEGRQVAEVSCKKPFSMVFSPDGPVCEKGNLPDLALNIDNFSLKHLNGFLALKQLPWRFDNGVLISKNRLYMSEREAPLVFDSMMRLGACELASDSRLYRNINYYQKSKISFDDSKIILNPAVLKLQEGRESLLEVVASGNYSGKVCSWDLQVGRIAMGVLKFLPLPDVQLERVLRYADKLPTMVMRLDLAGTNDFSRNVMELKEILLAIHSNGDIPMVLSLDPGLELQLSPFQWLTPLSGKLQLQSLDLGGVASDWLARKAIVAPRLVLDGAVNFFAEKAGAPLTSSGDLRVQFPGIRIPDGSSGDALIHQKFSVNGIGGKWQLDSGSSQLLWNDKPMAGMSVAARVDLDSGTAQGTCDLTGITGRGLGLFCKKQIPSDWRIHGSLAVDGKDSMQDWTVQGALNGTAGAERAWSLNLAGKGNLASGVSGVHLAVDGVNERWVQLWHPKLEALELNGNLAVQGNWIDRVFTLGGELHLNRYQQMEQLPVNGTMALQCELSPDLFRCSRFEADFKQQELALAHLSVQTDWPLTDLGGERGQINVSSNGLQLAVLQSLFDGDKDKERKTLADSFPKSGERKTMHFDFGPRPVALQLQMNQINWGDAVQADFSGNAMLQNKQLLLENARLSINGSQIVGHGEVVSGEDDVQYTLQLSNQGKMALKPLLGPFLPEAYERFSGEADQLQISVRGVSFQAPWLWDNLEGSCQVDFQSLSIPNTLHSTTLGRIFVLPIEVFSMLREFIPLDGTLPSLNRAVAALQGFYTATANVEFASGKVQINSKDGKIGIEQFRFNGPVVQELTFAGFLGLGSDQKLNLGSRVKVVGALLPVTISGELHDPQIDVAASAAEFVAGNTAAVLDAVGVGELKKNVDEPLRGAVDSFLNLLPPRQE